MYVLAHHPTPQIIPYSEDKQIVPQFQSHHSTTQLSNTQKQLLKYTKLEIMKNHWIDSQTPSKISSPSHVLYPKTFKCLILHSALISHAEWNKFGEFKQK
jgi:hypothetical protein